jgi:hypothetical protein
VTIAAITARRAIPGTKSHIKCPHLDALLVCLAFLLEGLAGLAAIALYAEKIACCRSIGGSNCISLKTLACRR